MRQSKRGINQLPQKKQKEEKKKELQTKDDHETDEYCQRHNDKQCSTWYFRDTRQCFLFQAFVRSSVERLQPQYSSCNNV